MPENTVEILSSFHVSDAVHRMKLTPLMQQKDFHFCRLGEGGEQTRAVLVSGLHLDLTQQPAVVEMLQKRARHAVIMVFIADLHKQAAVSLREWSKYADVFLVPTPDTQQVARFFTERPVEVLFDPIDFGFSDSYKKPPASEGPLKIVWFGYPESYAKSMSPFENALASLHQKKEIEYHIVTRNREYGPTPQCIIHPYIPESFPALLQTFDVCVLSHCPADFHINTYMKSENKALLAINRGLPVIASRTPAYTRLLTLCGLEEYLCNSGAGLLAAIEKLASVQERARYLERSQARILEWYSAAKMVRDWRELYHRMRDAKFPHNIKVAG